MENSYSLKSDYSFFLIAPGERIAASSANISARFRVDGSQLLREVKADVVPAEAVAHQLRDMRFRACDERKLPGSSDRPPKRADNITGRAKPLRQFKEP